MKGLAFFVESADHFESFWKGSSATILHDTVQIFFYKGERSDEFIVKTSSDA